jgi:hypothetical protein
MQGNYLENSIELVVHTHEDRGFMQDLLKNLSIIKEFTGAIVIISYNGSSTDYYSVLVKHGEAFGFDVRRMGECDAMTHFRHSAAECNSKYINLLHDDDILEPTIYSNFINTLKKNTKFKSFSCNDFIVLEGFFKYNRTQGKNLRKISRLELCIAYLLGRHAICFPSIIYNSAFLVSSDILEVSSLGKYSDVNITYFLTGVGHGFYAEPGFGYRIHKQQDSNKKTMNKWLLYCWLVWKVFINFKDFKFSSVRFLRNRILFK